MQRSVSVYLIHGVYEPLRVWGKALCQLANALRHLSLLTVIRGRSQVIQQLLCDDLQARVGAYPLQASTLAQALTLWLRSMHCKSKPALGLERHVKYAANH